MTTDSFTFPLVGAHFRPPAKAWLQVLASGQALELRPEPDNPADPNAVAVWLKTGAVPTEAQESVVPLAQGYGFTPEELAKAAEWHLGYIPAKEAVNIAPRLTGPIACTLGFSGEGKPMVSFGLPVAEAA